jgi:hypothetical protein
MMSDLRSVLNERVAELSQMDQSDLEDMLHVLERTYIHALIEQGLRGVSQS